MLIQKDSILTDSMRWLDGWLVGWLDRLNGHEFEQTVGGSEGQKSLVL